MATTERLFESEEFWERILPDPVRRIGVKTFVESATSSIGRIKRILLIHYGPENERLFLIFDPATPPLDEDPEEFARPLYLSDKNTLKPPEGLIMTRHESRRVTDSINVSFGRWELEKMPWPFQFSEDDYAQVLSERKNVRDAQKYVVWERPET